AVHVRAPVDQDQDAVDQRPDRAQATGEPADGDHPDRHADVAGVEAARPETAEQDLQQAGDQLRLVGVGQAGLRVVAVGRVRVVGLLLPVRRRLLLPVGRVASGAGRLLVTGLAVPRLLAVPLLLAVRVGWLPVRLTV